MDSPFPHIKSPYPGLRPFMHEEAPIFFGREEHVDCLLEKLQTTHFLAVVGESGCGKSSLVKAGMIPALSAGLLTEVGGAWRTVDMRPGDAPLERLSKQLEVALTSLHDTAPKPALEGFIHGELQRGRYGLLNVFQTAKLPPQTNLLILVDQFEEIFTYRQKGDPEQADAFINLLLTTVADCKLPIYVVITMRSDYLGKCARFDGLPEAVSESQYLVPRLTRDQMWQAIAEPARLFGGEVEPKLINLLINEAGREQDQLPLLQHLLMQMWRAKSESNTSAVQLEISDYIYESLGQALDIHAEKIYCDLSNDHKLLAEMLFRSITELGPAKDPVRRRIPLSQVEAEASKQWKAFVPIIEAFRTEECCFLTPPKPDELKPGTFVDISHESLIRHWRRLKEWVSREAEAGELYRDLVKAVNGWPTTEVDLLRERNLDKFSDWWQKGQGFSKPWADRYVTDENKEGKFYNAIKFLKFCEQELKKENRRKKRLVRTLFILLLAVFILIVKQLGKKTEEKNTNLARQLAADAENQLVNDPQLSVLLATEAVKLKEMPETVATLRLALSKHHLRYSLQGDDFALSPDGSRIATINADKTVQVRDAKTGRLVKQLSEGHKDSLTHIIFSKDGKLLATASLDNTVCIWNATTGHLIGRLVGHTAGINSLDFHPDGTHIATASDDKTARLWSVITGREIRVLKGHTEQVNYVTFSPDGKLVATGSGIASSRGWFASRVQSSDNSLRLWDAVNGTEIKKLDKYEEGISHITFSPNGRQLATVSYDNTLRLWDTSNFKPISSFTGHTKEVRLVRFSPKGKVIATASVDTVVRIYDIDINRDVKVFAGHEADVNDVAFSPDGRFIASAGEDTTIRLWDIHRGVEIRTYRGHQGPVIRVEFDPSGQQLISTGRDQSIRSWNVKIGDETAFPGSKDDNISFITFSPKDGHIAAANKDGTVWIFESLTESKPKQLPTKIGKYPFMTFSPDGNHIGITSDNQLIQLWEVKQLKKIPLDDLRHEQQERDPLVYLITKSLIFSANSKCMVVGYMDGSINIYDSNTGRKLAMSDTSLVTGISYAVSPDGTRIVSLGEKSAILWDTASNNIIDLPGQTDVFGVAFSPNGKFIATTSTDKTIKIWDVRQSPINTTKSRTLRGHYGAIWSVAFNSDSTLLATGGGTFSLFGSEKEQKDYTVRLWDTTNGKGLATLRGHRELVHSINFSPNGICLATGSFDGTVRLWDVAKGQELQTFYFKPDSIIANVAFSPDSKRLATVTDQGNGLTSAQLWSTEICGSTDDLLKLVNDRIGRELTDEERQQFLGR